MAEAEDEIVDPFPSLAQSKARASGNDRINPFPVLEARPTATTVDGEISLHIHQRRGEAVTSYTVLESEDGSASVPMAVHATTIRSSVQRELLVRSPWFRRLFGGPRASVIYYLSSEDCTDIFAEDSAARGVEANLIEPTLLELSLPSVGVGSKLLSARGLVQCLELSASSDPSLSTLTDIQQLTVYMWARVLELDALASTIRTEIGKVDAHTVAAAFSVAHATSDQELLWDCYWCVRKLMCESSTVPASWLDAQGPVRLSQGSLWYKSSLGTSLLAFSSVLEEDKKRKNKWMTPIDGYTLCQVHRRRSEDGNYPHSYELRLDHTGEILLTARRNDEQSPCQIFQGASSSSSSTHSEEYVGMVESNFWGTCFTVYDSGADVEALVKNSPTLKDLPMRRRIEAMKVVYELNIMGGSPRRITVDFDRGGVHHTMKNMQPRWDKKLNSYALPFFGRAKKASAKNFQLVVNDDPNNIYLILGKISKDEFCLDFRSPLSTLDAFAIATAALAKKRAVS